MSSNTQIEAIAGNQKTMSSLEISELVESRHDSVKRTIERLTNQGVIVQPPLVDEPGTDTLGRPRVTQVYRFSGERGKRDSIIVVAQLCPEFTARLVDRWQELEAEHKAPVVLSRLQLIEMAMESEKERLAAVAKSAALEEKIQAQAPKVEALSRIALSDGSFCLRDAAKNLQVREKDLYSFLVENRWIYRRPTGGAWLAYDDVRHRLLLEHKVTEGQREDGTNWSKSQVRVTPKGLAKLAEMLAEPPKEAAA